mgnify:CR=1 FL=1
MVTDVAAAARDGDLIEDTEEIEVEYAGESIDAGFNVGYLLDYLKMMIKIGRAHV